MMTRRLVVFAVLCTAVGCSSPSKTTNNNNESTDEGCEALQVGVTMVCVSTCGGGNGNSNPNIQNYDVGSGDPIFDGGSNAPPPPDFGNERPAPDLGEPDFGPPPDFGTPDMGEPPDMTGHDGGWPPADAEFEYADFCQLTLNADGTISEWHGDNEEFGTWSCSDGVVRVDNQFSGRDSYVLGDDGCLQGSAYNYR